jgi:hypothetical protein
MQGHSREEIAAADPFEGRGVFLEAPGAKSAEMLAQVTACAGSPVPAIAWDGIGAWIDLGSTELDVKELRRKWAREPAPLVIPS